MNFLGPPSGVFHQVLQLQLNFPSFEAGWKKRLIHQKCGRAESQKQWAIVVANHAHFSLVSAPFDACRLPVSCHFPSQLKNSCSFLYAIIIIIIRSMPVC